VRLAVLPVDGVRLDDWTVAPLLVLEDGGLHPRPPDVALAEGLADADLAALPGLWSAYGGEARARALAQLDAAAAAGRSVVVWVDGDQEVDLDHPAAVLFEQGPEAHRHTAIRRQAWPVLIHDHLTDLFGGDVAPVARGTRPRVGFCGQADAPWSGRARLLLGKARLHLAHALGRTDRLAGPWASHLRLRQRALEVLAADPRIDTDFVVRNRYRAGVTAHTERADRTSASSTEFFANIRSSAYTVCVRGGGNFSTRLYETLCLGRIPVVVDTGLVLPWSGRVPWDEIAVIVPGDSLDQLADRVVAHHASLDDDAFLAHQQRCRDLWVDRLSVDGFFAHLPELLAP
jgi:Exostosin family